MRHSLSIGRLASVLLLTGCLIGAVQAQDGTLRNRMDPAPNITSSGQPTEAALEALADEGFATVIDLRRPGEDRGIDEQSAVEGLGMSYVSLPVDGANGVTFENATFLDQIIANAQGPVLVHCGSGNRAGALLALRESVNGADDEAAIQFGREANLRGLEPTVRERLAEDDAR